MESRRQFPYPGHPSSLHAQRGQDQASYHPQTNQDISRSVPQTKTRSKPETPEPNQTT